MSTEEAPEAKTALCTHSEASKERAHYRLEGTLGYATEPAERAAAEQAEETVGVQK